MKAAFISDIHGNSAALEAVLEDIKEKQADKIYVLGDLCYRGPEPKRSLELIQALHTEVIKGNADEWVVRGVERGEVADQALELMNKEREWTLSKLDQEDINYLRTLPKELHLRLDDLNVHAFHAAPDNLFTVIAGSEPDEVLQEKLMFSTQADLYIYAHIHKPFIRYINGKVIMNIGSVGLPFDGVKKASYGLLDTDGTRFSTSIERVAFDTEKVVAQFKNVNYPNQNMIRVIEKASL
ncbi:metallophosphoesterase family protein [Domibacillus indicus]|uniref:metallophosphoesterase family protein n=1 Tax=Domibacillus indicus TaxID=1437523 RepID=UPI000617D5AF|nr:metallophosphoesterase family protein [Domibacillus indicus]